MAQSEEPKRQHSCCGGAPHGETGSTLVGGSAERTHPKLHELSQAQAQSHAHAGHGHQEHAGHAGMHEAGTIVAKKSARDPVCGMTVDPATTPHRAEHAGQPYYFCCAGCAAKFVADPERYLTKSESLAHGTSAAIDGVRDPVCGMTVDPHTTPHRGQHAGQPYYFCSAGCAAKFAADPEKYLTKADAKPPQAVPEGTIYTCPMHPQIRQVGPGSCPICGMALEPELVSAEAEPNPELADMTRRFWVGLVLTLPVLALEMGGHLTNLHMLIGQTASNWLQFAFATPVVLWAGWPFFVRGWRSLVTRNLNMFTLIVTRQPYMKGRGFRVSGALATADAITERSFWIGVYPGLTPPMLDYAADRIREFLGVGF